jgi:hypothetical protein
LLIWIEDTSVWDVLIVHVESERLTEMWVFLLLYANCIIMKNLLNCHAVGLHSFPISFENGLYKRIFCTDIYHQMWRPIELAIHPHHVDIKITVLQGHIYNPIYRIDDKGTPLYKYQWNSHILNGRGGFESKGIERIALISNEVLLEGDTTIMKACELHTVQIDKHVESVWLIEESIPTCDYFPINYSPHDLTKWTPDGLYQEVNDIVKMRYISKFLPLVI